LQESGWQRKTLNNNRSYDRNRGFAHPPALSLTRQKVLNYPVHPTCKSEESTASGRKQQKFKAVRTQIELHTSQSPSMVIAHVALAIVERERHHECAARLKDARDLI